MLMFLILAMVYMLVILIDTGDDTGRGRNIYLTENSLNITIIFRVILI
jgi:hypothetical protein